MSEEKIERHPATLAREGRVIQLHDGGTGRVGALIDHALANLTAEQARNLSGKAAAEALRLEVKQREQNLDYVAGKKTIEDHIDAFAMLEKQGKLTRQTVVSEIKTGTGNMRIESKSGPTWSEICFVATATYGGADHPNVRFLRAYRDGCLAHTRAGRAFIAWYWRTGPRLAKWVERSAALKLICRCVLSGLVLAIKLLWKSPAGHASPQLIGVGVIHESDSIY